MSAAEGKAAGGLSIFFPAFNDAGTIPSMVQGAVIAARRITDDFDVVVVRSTTKPSSTSSEVSPRVVYRRRSRDRTEWFPVSIGIVATLTIRNLPGRSTRNISVTAARSTGVSRQ